MGSGEHIAVPKRRSPLLFLISAGCNSIEGGERFILPLMDRNAERTERQCV